MSNIPPPAPGFSFAQRLALAILCAMLLVFALIQYVRRPVAIDEAAITQGPLTLPARVDPNTASVAELTRIPHLAQSLAEKIVAYRQEAAGGGVMPVFARPIDLTRVPGVKQKTLEQLLPYLEFPEEGDSPATGPSS